MATDEVAMATGEGVIEPIEHVLTGGPAHEIDCGLLAQGPWWVDLADCSSTDELTSPAES